ncbi:hypothetical protein CQW23_12078 [Capsicum baccatum]|uniref:Uncharacterized protein n=1 Tax=Capsicum baccatum TaxID=33114 RepID=A0A2G2WRR9_CAPBA|nr:hypothetical protein CQW23_12078 [Capsicum baccatum]
MVHIQARLLEAFNESIQIPGSHLSKRQAEEFVDGISKIGICLGTMVEKLKASFFPILDKFLPYVSLMYYEEWIPLLPRVHCNKNPSVPQIVATAIGICAEFGAYFLKAHTTVIFLHLKTVMEHPDAKNLDNIMDYEAAVSTCAKVRGESYWPWWILYTDYNIFAEVLWAGNDLATEETTTRIINLLKKFQREMQPTVLSITFETLPLPHQSMLCTV